MLEGFFSDVLTQCLGDYIQSVSPDRMKVALWGGYAEISTVEIRSEALRKLELPVVIKEGYIGTVRITVPWNSLGSKPIALELENVILIATPKESEMWNEEEELNREQAEKRLLVEKFDLDDLEARRQERQGFSSEFMNKLFDNIQLRISGFHLRFENTSEEEGRGFCCGVTIGSCKIENTDSTFTPCFSTDRNAIFKLLMIQDLAVYWNVGEAPMVYSSSEELCKKLSMQIAQKDKKIDGLNYILEPLSTSVKITISRKCSSEIVATPDKQGESSSKHENAQSVSFSVLLTTMVWQVTPLQFLSIGNFIEELTRSRKRIPFLKFRPSKCVKDDPRAWLFYAINAVLVDYRSRKACYSRDAITTRRRQRIEYMSLYQVPRSERHPEAQRRLETLEDELCTDDIIIFRVLAKREALLALNGASPAETSSSQESKLSKEEQEIQQQILQSSSGLVAAQQGSASNTSLTEVLHLCDTQTPWLRDVVYGILCGSEPPPLATALSPSDMALRIAAVTIKLGKTYSYIEGVCCDVSRHGIKGTIRSLCIGEKRKRISTQCKSLLKESNCPKNNSETEQVGDDKISLSKQFTDNTQHAINGSEIEEEIDYLYTYGERTDLKVPRLSQKIQMALAKMVQDRKEKEEKEKLIAEREAAEKQKRIQEEQEKKKREEAEAENARKKESGGSRFSSLFSFINRNILLNDSSSEEDEDDSTDNSESDNDMESKRKLDHDETREISKEKQAGNSSSSSSFMKSFDRLKAATLNFAEAKVKSVASQLAAPVKSDTTDFQELTDMPAVIESQFEQLAKEKPFLSFEFSVSSDTAMPDYSLQVSTTQPITVIYNKRWIEDTCKFVIENFTAAGKVLTAFTGSDFVRELDMALTETKTIALNVNIFSPKVYVPVVTDERTSSKSYLLLDFGTFHCTTAPASVLDVLGKKFMQDQSATACNSSELIKELDSKDLFYDMFTMQLASVQVSIVDLKTELIDQTVETPCIDNATDSSVMRLRWKTVNEPLNIINPFNLYVNFLVSLLPLNVKLPLFCASILLPRINASISTDQVHMLSRQIDYYVIETLCFVENVSKNMMTRNERTHFERKSRKASKQKKAFDPIAILKENEIMINVEYASVALTSPKDNKALISSAVNGFSLTKKTKVKSAYIDFKCKDFEVVDHLTPSKDPKCPNFLITSKFAFDEDTTFKAVNQDLFLNGQALFSSSLSSVNETGIETERDADEVEIITANVYFPNVAFFVHPETAAYFLLYLESFKASHNQSCLPATDFNSKTPNCTKEREQENGTNHNSGRLEQDSTIPNEIVAVTSGEQRKISLTFSASSASLFLFYNDSLFSACVMKECCATVTPEEDMHTKINFVLPVILCFDVQKAPILVITSGEEQQEKQLKESNIIAKKMTSMKKKTRSAVERIERRTAQTVPLTTNDCVVVSVDAYNELPDGRTSDIVISFNKLIVNPNVLFLLQPLSAILDTFSEIPSSEHNVSILIRRATITLSPDYAALKATYEGFDCTLDSKINAINVNLEDFSFHLRVSGDATLSIHDISTFGKVDVFAARSVHELFPIIQQTQVKAKATFNSPRCISTDLSKEVATQETAHVMVEFEKVRVNVEQSYFDGLVCTIVSTIDFVESHFHQKLAQESDTPLLDLQVQSKLFLFTFEAHDEMIVSSSVGLHALRIHFTENRDRDVNLECAIGEVKIKDFDSSLVVLSRTSLEKKQQDAVSVRLSGHTFSFALSDVLLTPSVPELFTNVASVASRTARFFNKRASTESHQHQHSQETALNMVCSFSNVNIFIPASKVQNGVDFSGILLTLSGNYESERVEKSILHKVLLRDIHLSRRDISFYHPSCSASAKQSEMIATGGVQEISSIHPLLQQTKKMFIAPYRYLFTKGSNTSVITFFDCDIQKQSKSFTDAEEVKENTFSLSSSMLVAPFSMFIATTVPNDHSSGGISDISVVVDELKVTACPSDCLLCAEGIASIINELPQEDDKQVEQQTANTITALPQLSMRCSSISVELSPDMRRSLCLFRLGTGPLSIQGNLSRDKYLLSMSISALLCESLSTTQLKWEPILERWSADLFVKFCLLGLQAESQQNQTASISIALESKDTFNVNITQTLVQDLSLCFSSAKSSKEEVEHLVQFENKIGAPVGVSVTVDVDNQRYTTTARLKFSETKYLSLNSKYLDAFSHLAFDVTLETAVVSPSRVLSPRRRGSKPQSLAAALTTSWRQLPNGIVQRVSFEHGTPKVTFDSPCTVRNATDICLEIMLEQYGVQTQSTQITPGTEWGIPPTMLPSALVQQPIPLSNSNESKQHDARFRFCFGDGKTSEWLDVSFRAPARQSFQNVVVTVKHENGSTTVTVASYLKLVNLLPFGVSFIVLNEGIPAKQGEHSAVDPLSLSHRECNIPAGASKRVTLAPSESVCLSVAPQHHEKCLSTPVQLHFFDTTIQFPRTEQLEVDLNDGKRMVISATENVVDGTLCLTLFTPFLIADNTGLHLTIANVEKTSFGVCPDMSADGSFSVNKSLLLFDPLYHSTKRMMVVKADMTDYSEQVDLGSIGVNRVISLKTLKGSGNIQEIPLSINVSTVRGLTPFTHLITISPGIVLVNYLPTDIVVKQEGSEKLLVLEQGAMQNLVWQENSKPKRIAIKERNIDDQSWSCYFSPQESKSFCIKFIAPYETKSFAVPSLAPSIGGQCTQPQDRQESVVLDDTQVRQTLVHSPRPSTPSSAVSSTSSTGSSVNELLALEDDCKTRVGDYAWITSSSNAFNTIVSFEQCSEQNLPAYRIDNRTKYTLILTQRGCSETTVVYASQSLYYCWEDNEAPLKQLEVDAVLSSDNVVHYSAPVELDKLDRNVLLSEAKYPHCILSYSVEMSGVLKVLTIIDQSTQTHCGADADSCASLDQKKSNVNNGLTLSVNLSRIGISLVGGSGLEILYLSFDEAMCELSVTPQQSYVGLSFGAIRCDNQLDDAMHPIALYFGKQKPSEEGSGKSLRLAVVRHKTDNPNFMHIEHLQLHIREFFVCVDEGLLDSILRFTVDARKHIFSSETETGIDWVRTAPLDFRQLAPRWERESTRYVYVEGMLINTVQFCLSFMPSPNPSGSMLREEFNGIALLAIENASIRLSALIQNQSFGRAKDITETIGAYYKSQLVSQLYRLFFGLDLIGCPQVLFSFCGTGIRDLFYEPAKGIFLGPREFVSGMGKGLQSMVKNCTYGLAYSSGKLFGSVSGALAHLSADSEYVREHNERRARAAPTSLGEGFIEGMKDFGSGVLSGVAGAIASPAAGLLNDGLSGFAQGVGKGVLGLFVKPVIGAIDLVAMTTSGVTAMSSQDGYRALRRRRYPRVPPHNPTVATLGVLRPYCTLGAEGRAMLCALCKGELGEERYVYHCYPESVSPRYDNDSPLSMPLAECTTLPKDSASEVIMLTSKRILHFTVKTDEKAYAELSLCWCAVFNNISSVAVSGRLLKVMLKSQKNLTIGLCNSDAAQFCILLAQLTQHP